MNVAKKTVLAIEEAIYRDQGGRYREILRETVKKAEDAYRPQESGFREHLGASVIGKECVRAIWYDYRWVRKATHQPRILRLFNRGHLEEARFSAMIQAAGFKFGSHNVLTGEQFGVKAFHDHFGGSMDGWGSGFPDTEDEIVLTEFKTHSLKSFEKLAGKDWRDYLNGVGSFSGAGVRSAKFEHFVQMQVYMGLSGLKRAVYFAVNKNDDDLYAEVVDFDKTVFDWSYERAWSVLSAQEPPKKINDDPSWFGCRFCAHKELCHRTSNVERNCRTCIHGGPSTDGWYCSRKNRNLTKDLQLAGCEDDYQKIQKL